MVDTFHQGLAPLVQAGRLKQLLAQFRYDIRLDRARAQRLMQTIDTLNHTRDKPIHWAAEGLNLPWTVQFNRRSPRYTICWDELMKVGH